MIKEIYLPLNDEKPVNLQVEDKIQIYGKIFTGRDAALPKLVRLIEKDVNPLDLRGSAFMHTAVSEAGISPTTSNKVEIEESMPFLSKVGVKMHLGKGSLSLKTIEELNKYNSVFIVVPPAAALLSSKIISKKVVAFAQEGMEAIYQLEVAGIPGVVSVAHGKSLN